MMPGWPNAPLGMRLMLSDNEPGCPEARCRVTGYILA